MKTATSSLLLLLIATCSFSQTKKTELFDFIKVLVQDSTQYSASGTGDWAVGSPRTFPVHWESDRIIMSDDMKINFYRKGTVNISVKGKTLNNGATPSKWMLMLRGPRSGYSSFNITSPYKKNIHPKQTIDSLLPAKQYTYKLLQSCDSKTGTGFYYYQLSIPKKVASWLKIEWNCKDAACNVSIYCYDDWSKQYADLNCP
jgi:hypothetical protein